MSRFFRRAAPVASPCSWVVPSASRAAEAMSFRCSRVSCSPRVSPRSRPWPGRRLSEGQTPPDWAPCVSLLSPPPTYGTHAQSGHARVKVCCLSCCTVGALYKDDKKRWLCHLGHLHMTALSMGTAAHRIRAD